MLFPRRIIINTGGGGGGSGSGDTINIGTPSDGTYEDGVLNLTPDTTISNAIDDINELLKYVVPEPPEPLSGNLLLSVIPKSGYISNYTNLGDLTAGSQYNIIVNTNSLFLLTPNSKKFSDADKGILVLYKNDTNIDSFDLAGHFNDDEREGCQSYTSSNGFGTNGYIKIIEVCWYNSFPAYQKGKARFDIGSILDVGYNKFKVVHQLNSETRSTNDIVIYYDDADRPSITDMNVSISHEAYKYLSGVKFLTTGSQISISLSASGIFDKTYVQYPVVLVGNVIPNIEISWNDPNASGFSNPPNYNDLWNFSNTIDILTNVSDNKIIINATPRDPFGNGETMTYTINNVLINGYSVVSTEKHEYFQDENYRLPIDDYDSVPSQITGQWDSTQVLTNGNAQVFNGKLIYPHENYSGGTYIPAQSVDYSGFTGPQVYVRAIKDTDPHTNGSLHINDISWDDIQNGKLELYIKLPGQTGWLDLSKDFNVATFTGSDGDGIHISHTQSGNTLIINWTTGSFSTSSSGYMYILKIVINDVSVQVGELWDFE